MLFSERVGEWHLGRKCSENHKGPRFETTNNGIERKKMENILIVEKYVSHYKAK